MTLIVGLSLPGLNAIIADTRVSWIDSDGNTQGRDTALKTGKLFPGCIFGCAGDVSAASEFIRSYKELIRSASFKPENLWAHFTKYVEDYEFKESKDFKLLLSHRFSGRPVFAELDSRHGLDVTPLPQGLNLLAFGSGVEPLREKIKSDFAPRLLSLQETLHKEKKLPIDFIKILTPYFLCLWLSELSLTFEKEWLAGHSVGGIFHFVAQSNGHESRQKPTLYCFSTSNVKERKIYTWIYKIVAAANGLLIEERTPSSISSQTAIFDPIAFYDLETYSEEKLQAMVDEKWESVGSSFFFCGFGFTNPDDRGGFGFITNEDEKNLFTKSGTFHSWLIDGIVENFTGKST